ncbi:MAG: Gfo/Idh/MocA family oxidoreductase [Eubacteriales bacterium]|nr:Gfo/Idh/MocA family oxidoreductase [Eubacteriales bacterium]
MEEYALKVLKVVLVGAGNRGEAYADIMHQAPDKFQVVAVAEPVESRRKDIAKKHGIPDERCFSDYSELFALGKIADVAAICTMDQQHFEPVMKAISLKYDILLEKPVSPVPKECLKMANYAREEGVKIIVCHVLRYTHFFKTIKGIIDDGLLGEIISINHEECVGNVHQSHSFVRGNWGNSDRSSCMLLQKSCHDMDILQWLIGKKCKKIQSFGSLRFFKQENAPEGSPERCIDGCPVAETCPYNAVKIYLDDKDNYWFRSTSTKSPTPTDELVEEALRTTQYGKCVFKCDNNVVDHQTVNMIFEDDITVTFTMCAFNAGGRHIHIMGTKGELRGSITKSSSISVYDFATKETKQIPMDGMDGIKGGHGGGDRGIVHSLYDYLTGTYTGKAISDIGISAQNHLLVFAAEKSRFENTIVDMDDYIKELEHL